MQRSTRSRLALLVASAVPLLARAGEAVPDPPLPLRWAEVAALVARHPALLEAAARERGAAGAAAAAGEIPNPTFGLSAGSARPRGGGASRSEWGASVELPLDFLAVRGPRLAAARASEEAAREEARATRAELLRELRRAFAALAHRQAAVEAGAELEAQVAAFAALVRRRAERGEGRPGEVYRVETELWRLRGALARDRAAAEGHRQRLAAWIGAPVGRVEADLTAAPPLPPLEEARARALLESPALQGLRARALGAEAEAGAARRERLPKVTLGGGHVEELDRTASTVTASLTLPLWGWNQGRIREAEAAAEAARARAEAQGRALAAGLAEAWQGCAAGQESARRFQAEVLPRAEASARNLGRAFELGETGLLDVIDARRVLLEARREHLDLLLDMQNACADLAALAGLELP